MVCLTLGTGIGGGLVINGELFRGTYGMAGEWGHMTTVPGGHWCECGNRGCWEQYASGNALVREARALLRAGGPGADAAAGRPRRRARGAQRAARDGRGDGGRPGGRRPAAPTSAPGSAWASPTSSPASTPRWS